jgi:hypothetical protein
MMKIERRQQQSEIMNHIDPPLQKKLSLFLSLSSRHPAFPSLLPLLENGRKNIHSFLWF